ncbi:MAG: family 78 glycoside hydrolase catalytic domain [Alistipes sp.]|nr:family 78 glycoside hydrolase catalytic domain [Candidatus Minthomonas equi]
MFNIFKPFFPAIAAITFISSCSTQPAKVFRTDALDNSAWSSSVWISAENAPVLTGNPNDNYLAADGSSWFLSSVKNDAKLRKAVWMTTGLGVYELYVNGKTIGDEFLKPGFTHPYKTKRSFTYDVTAAMNLSAGEENTLSVQVTPGWWADKIITPGDHDGMIGKKCAFRGVLELTFTDGSTKLIGTSTHNWKAGIAGPVQHAAIFDGERFDARIQPGYATPEILGAAEENTEFKGEILPSAGAEIYIREDLTLSPIKAYTWKGTEGANDEAFGKVVITKEIAAGQEFTLTPGQTLVVDFGQNCAAVPSFVFKAAKGTCLTCLPGELLNDGNGAKSRGMDGPEGSVHRTNLRTPDDAMRIDYTFAGNEDFESYHPRYSFFGYRFISVTATADVTIREIKSIPVTSITKEMETGTLTTGNELINKLISNTIWGQRSNYLSVPTDCPQRNERLGWTADTQVFAETGAFFANTKNFFHKWMRDIRDTQREFGGFPGVAPFPQYGAEPTSMMRLGWSDAGIIVPWIIWRQFGDTQIIEENWDAIARFMQHIYETKYDHERCIAENGNYQWADWLSYEDLESTSGRAWITDAKGHRICKPETIEYWSYLGASYWVSNARMMRDMAAATGRDASIYEKMADEGIRYIKDRFFNEKGEFRVGTLNTMQTPALFALRNGIVDGMAKEAMIVRLRENFTQHDNCLQTGFLGTSILMKTLTENGMSDIAYNLLFQRKNPSWLYSVDNGATTIWERWNSYTLEHGMGPKGMNSFNHYAYGAVCAWIWETAAGICADTNAPGFTHFILQPIPDKRLGFIKAEYASAAGLIKSDWKYEGDKWIWNFTIPKGTSASVILPGETQAIEYRAGTYTIEK